MEKKLEGFKVAVLATDGFEESELTVPVKELRDAGAKVHIISPHGDEIQGFRHHEPSMRVESDRKLIEIQSGEYDAVLLPGGVMNADALRIDKNAQQFVRAMDEAKKPIAVICHGAWLLVSAGLMRGRKVTSWPTLADDIRNAGGDWEDQEVRVDKTWVSSRNPGDLPAFCREMITLFKKGGINRKSVAA